MLFFWMFGKILIIWSKKFTFVNQKIDEVINPILYHLLKFQTTAKKNFFLRTLHLSDRLQEDIFGPAIVLQLFAKLIIVSLLNLQVPDDRSNIKTLQIPWYDSAQYLWQKISSVLYWVEYTFTFARVHSSKIYSW